MTTFGSRLKHAFNTFFAEDQDRYAYAPNPVPYNGPATSTRPDRNPFRYNSERTIISSIYTRLSVDVAAIRIEHVRVDEDEQYLETIKSGLNNCLKVEANLDQGARHFRQDIASSLFQEGCIAIVPVETDLDPRNSSNWDVKKLRIGSILQWWPNHVEVQLYDEREGRSRPLILPKSMVAIVENPFYSVMNEPNSTLKRLIHKLSLLDHVDEISSSGKLDVIIQVPYVVKSESRKAQAEQRRKEMEEQLASSTYGIAWADGTEKITQLNRAVENNLLAQVQYLKEELFNELGLTEQIMNGTADDVTMLNYINRTIEPVMDAITEAMARTFLSKTARTQGQTIQYFQDPFRLIPISQLADVVDVFSRNQIVTPNEVRPALGLKPSKQAQANALVNSNMPLDDQITDDGLEEDASDEFDAEEAKLERRLAELEV